MGLLNKPTVGGAVTTPTGTPVGGNVLDKRSRAQERRAKKYEAACTLRDALVAANVKLTADQNAAIALLCRIPKVGGGGFGENTFNKIFGANPQVGQAVTVTEIFRKTTKGISQMNGLVRKWAAKNVATLEYVHNATDPFESQYIIRSLGTGNASVAEGK